MVNMYNNTKCGLSRLNSQVVYIQHDTDFKINDSNNEMDKSYDFLLI